MMESSVLDRKAARVMDYPLTVGQQLWLLFVLPTALDTVLYIVDIATDVAIGVELINEGHTNTGWATVALLYTTPLVSLLTSLATPPADATGVLRLANWILVEIFNFILFPLRPIRW